LRILTTPFSMFDARGSRGIVTTERTSLANGCSASQKRERK
jgi:hypothetical protein